ncbi:hypothetical protein IFM89_033106 [Coptis chinensis]|uniref:Uncharacterized protein n=1 Tax=Coptis chinensis TaxID=261450 RepID=A0A835MAV0_9MAGN|nr:hypothetical protein IFM89_033106 [Coptis chinensis]
MNQQPTNHAPISLLFKLKHLLSINPKGGRSKIMYVMASSSTCCLIPPSTTSIAPANSSKPNQLSWHDAKVGSWRKQCFVGMTCMVLASEMMPLLGGDCCAIAENLQIHVEEPKKNGTKWSDKRACAAWNINSLEIIVPENLPRPSSHRKSDSITFSNQSNSRVEVIIRTSGNCFSM